MSEDHLGLRPIICRPSDEREALFQRACCRVGAICDAHEVIRPHIRRADGSRHFGYWCRGVIKVNVSRCTPPAFNPGYSWSFPGYKADRTVVGVTLHELGHHIWWAIGEESNPDSWLAHYTAWREAGEDEAAVSGYEPNVEETFAEAWKLFCTNPDLLRVGRPQRWALLRESGLRPPHLAPWREVLQHAHPRMIAAAESWIAQEEVPA